jgi:KDO2-lipid IV(A) lauroyltransferase
VVSAAIVHAAEFAIPRVPSALSTPLAEIMGTAAWAAAPAARAAVLANLKVIAPERAHQAAVRRVFVEQSRNYLEIFQIPHIAPERLLASIEHRGFDHFLRAHERGLGVVVASAHLGPISLVGQILVAHGFETYLSIETERSEVGRAINRARAAMGLQLIPTETPFGVFRALRRHKVFGILADRAVTGVGERVPFFGREALIPSAHVALALRTGAPLIPAFSGRENGKLTASFEPPLELPSTGNREADVREGVRRWVRVLERYVRNAPEQWTVFERVWVGTP